MMDNELGEFKKQFDDGVEKKVSKRNSYVYGKDENSGGKLGKQIQEQYE
jgi:hypothetical protein